MGKALGLGAGVGAPGCGVEAARKPNFDFSPASRFLFSCLVSSWSQNGHGHMQVAKKLAEVKLNQAPMYTTNINEINRRKNN